ncbi:MAG: NAD(P)-dependent oxidoreductase [Phycisphaerae bacterium]|nr:NAD(P)-dependent oxidoreductase [Phycisphaerae bacterium]
MSKSAAGEVRRIGFIGTGIMGVPMAGHLLGAGHHVYCHSRTRQKADALIARGATWCETPADVGHNCDLLITIVTDTPDVEAVLFNEYGAAATLPAGACVVDMSTISPARTREFAGRLAVRDVTLLDAPVTGGDVGARNATLTIMVGGDAAAFERVRPVLELMGRNVVHVGPSGSGQALKACNQILCAVNMIGVCEALTLAQRSGLDLPLAIQTLASGAGGSWAWQNLGSKIVADDLEPAFMIKLIQKDLRIVQETAQAATIPLPGTALAQQLFRAVEAEPGGGELGTQAMIRAIRKLAGSDDAR